MWKSLNPGERVKLGDIIRHISSLSKSAFGEENYEVVRTELHYFEIAPKPERTNSKERDRKIVRYIDIGYHLIVEVWLDQFTNANGGFSLGNL
jgi:hypothetical protein